MGLNNSLKSFTLGCKVDCGLKSDLCLSVQPHPSSLPFLLCILNPKSLEVYSTGVPRSQQESPVVLYEHGCDALPFSILLAESS